MHENQAKTELLPAATKLHKAAGMEWKEFTAALREFVSATAETMVMAPTEKLSFAQGRAQFARELIALLDKA